MKEGVQPKAAGVDHHS